MNYDLTKDPIYYDGVHGLVTCRIIRLVDPSSVEIEITARSNRIYRNKETITAHISNIIPRAAVHTHFGQLRIRPYKWQPFNQ